MITFIKAQAVLIVASLADYLTVIILVELLNTWYVTANTAGNVAGGILQFLLSRNWAFRAGAGRTGRQLYKFILVWIGNIILSAAAIFFLTHYLAINYIISKTISSVLLGLTYNYILQKKYVFSNSQTG